ncbi:MAG: hypothetical protein GF330_04660 [Candidatus Eisenbacteria bacterium]|nr:hypothetical protein [Candidatus Eisenbacteria bacterium]
MLDSLRPAAYVVIFLLVALWVYFRLLNSGKKRGRHGRDLWYSRLEDRRRERIEGAPTWEERRRRRQATAPERKIAARFLKEVRGEDGAARGGDGAGHAEKASRDAREQVERRAEGDGPCMPGGRRKECQ